MPIGSYFKQQMPSLWPLIAEIPLSFHYYHQVIQIPLLVPWIFHVGTWYYSFVYHITVPSHFYGEEYIVKTNAKNPIY